MTLRQKLGLEAAGDELVGVGYRPGRKAAKVIHAVIHAMLAGGDCMDDADMLRAGAIERIVVRTRPPLRRLAPSCASSRSAICASSTG